MDHKLFLEKLSEVAEWEWRDVQGTTNHNWRADTDDIENPKYIHIKRLKTRECNIEENYHATTLIKPYSYQRKTFLVERCPDCGWAKTPHSDWFKVEHISSIATQAYFEEFGGKKNSFVKKKKHPVVEMLTEDGYIIQESEFGVIRRRIDK